MDLTVQNVFYELKHDREASVTSAEMVKLFRTKYPLAYSNVSDDEILMNLAENIVKVKKYGDPTRAARDVAKATLEQLKRK